MMADLHVAGLNLSAILVRTESETGSKWSNAALKAEELGGSLSSEKEILLTKNCRKLSHGEEDLRGQNWWNWRVCFLMPWQPPHICLENLSKCNNTLSICLFSHFHFLFFYIVCLNKGRFIHSNMTLKAGLLPEYFCTWCKTAVIVCSVIGFYTFDQFSGGSIITECVWKQSHF